MNTQFELILILIAGLTLILLGANYLTDGSAAIARRFNVSGFVVGLTIVAIGTSMPEMVVSVISALKGSTDIAIGNVVGSNSFNTLIILGMCAVVKPLILTQSNVHRDIPMGIIASVILLIFTLSGAISRIEGMIMFILYISMMIYAIRNGRPSKEEQELDKELESAPQMAVWLAIVMVVGGLVGLIYGGSLFIDSAVGIAEFYNIPANIIAVTLVAGGTSLPEFAASLVSLIKGKSDIALGNVIGSNIANILLVLGASSVFTPLTLGSITMIDISVVLLSSILLFVSAFTLGKKVLDRAEGAILILLYIVYIYYIVSRAVI
ncbi:MAG: calcium/sodium antiporter [Rikenellaceae bacterium]